jgi:hypothetical protein
MYLTKIDEFSVWREKQNSLSDSTTDYRVRWGASYKCLPFPYKQHGNLPAPGDVREIAFQVGVGAKAYIEIGRDQESVASDSYEGIAYLWLRGTRNEEGTFNIYIGGTNRVPMYRRFGIELVCDGSTRPSPPEIATYVTSRSLKC